MLKRITYFFAVCMMGISAAGMAESVYEVGALNPWSNTDSGIASLMVRDAEATDERINQAEPIIILGDTEHPLEISFDQLSHETHLYSYTLLLLNADGSPASLSQSEYINGFNSADITDYEHSFNTHQLYTHYRFSFPNDDMQPLLSGSYALIIYENGDPKNVQAVVRLAVIEPIVSIQATHNPNSRNNRKGYYQQIDIDVQLNDISLTNPEEIKLIVSQNGRTDNRALAPRPTYIEPNKLRWVDCPSLLFEGGNEYRRLDIGSEYLMGAQVDHVVFDQTTQTYHAFLFPSENLSTSPYQTEPDADGAFVINRERNDYDDTEADYMWVHFSLPVAQPWLDGALYVLGDAWHNSLTPASRMQYISNGDSGKPDGTYTFACYLKQGGYNWQYVFLSKEARLNHQSATLLRTEGSHWQTGNTYRIYVYYRPFSARYDRLVGCLVWRAN